MKIVKLDRRYKQFKEHGHTVGIMFDRYTNESRDVEDACREIFNTSSWDRSGPWCGYFGSYRKRERDEWNGGFRQYWITFKDESAVSLILLKMNQTN